MAEASLLSENVAEAAERLSDKAVSTASTTSTCIAEKALQAIAPAVDDDSEADTAHDKEMYAQLDYSFIKELPPLDQVVPQWRQPLLPPQTRSSAMRKTLVLDLDETLVHSTLDECDSPDFTFQVTFGGKDHAVHVRRRPHLQEFLERVAELFEVVVFTASQKVYAEQLLNIIDPQRRLVRHRIYRDSCVYYEGNYLKDLTVLGRDLRSTVIVDNSPQAFGFQLANGIPIESWYDDEKDQELTLLLPFLESLISLDDVRPSIQNKFKLQELVDKAPRVYYV
jgi:CTD small phosphatase-like protein 2